MTPAARIQAAIEVLDRVLDGALAEKALSSWARRSRFAGAKDRAAIRDHVFQALRCRRSYAALGGGLSGRGLMLGAQYAAGKDPSEVFSGVGYAPAALSPAEATPGDAAPADLLDLPDWLAEEFSASLGPNAPAAAHALRGRAPVMLRVNRARLGRAEAIETLERDRIVAVESAAAPCALRVTEGARRIMNSDLYLSGKIELQDGSSQSAMDQIQVVDASRVLDYCAGGGGKTLALAGRARAHWFAHDAEPARMVDLPARAARAGISVRLMTQSELRAAPPFDLVLCDVPCSGSGTWRRTPEAKWALTPERLAELTRIQAEILRDAARLVAPGGCLAYATCSVLSQENDQQIKSFADAFPEWIQIAEHRWPISGEGDGFYLAQLERAVA